MGKIGGVIESEDNLSQEGGCWVARWARVASNARVTDDAQVYGNARVGGTVLVAGEERVSGNDQVMEEGDLVLDVDDISISFRAF